MAEMSDYEKSIKEAGEAGARLRLMAIAKENAMREALGFPLLRGDEPGKFADFNDPIDSVLLNLALCGTTPAEARSRILTVGRTAALREFSPRR